MSAGLRERMPSKSCFEVMLRVLYCVPVAPVAYQVILEPGIGQFHEFESRPRAYSYISVGIFSCAQNGLRKARERDVSKHSMKNRRAVGLLNPMRDKKNWRQEPGGEKGRHPPVTTACPEAGK